MKKTPDIGPSKVNYPVLILCLSILWSAACGGTGAADIGSVVKNFRLDTLEHDRFYLNRHKGKVVVLVFWATWCRACKTEMVELQAALKRPAWQDVVVAAVNTDPENLSDVKRIVQDLGITYPILLDRRAGLFNRFAQPALPVSIVIDTRQRLSFLRVGYDRALIDQLQTKILKLVNSENT